MTKTVHIDSARCEPGLLRRALRALGYAVAMTGAASFVFSQPGSSLYHEFDGRLKMNTDENHLPLAIAKIQQAYYREIVAEASRKVGWKLKHQHGYFTGRDVTISIDALGAVTVSSVGHPETVTKFVKYLSGHARKEV